MASFTQGNVGRSMSRPTEFMSLLLPTIIMGVEVFRFISNIGPPLGSAEKLELMYFVPENKQEAIIFRTPPQYFNR